jgi:hypothetical protein
MNMRKNRKAFSSGLLGLFMALMALNCSQLLAATGEPFFESHDWMVGPLTTLPFQTQIRNLQAGGATRHGIFGFRADPLSWADDKH